MANVSLQRLCDRLQVVYESKGSDPNLCGNTPIYRGAAAVAFFFASWQKCGQGVAATVQRFRWLREQTQRLQPKAVLSSVAQGDIIETCYGSAAMRCSAVLI